ncbi:MAG: DUF1553 domain-containing protein [Saprospiraceae bacterium]|nr:DUF1553 domain-containing protein [Saprospiraceae bacterium]
MISRTSLVLVVGLWIIMSCGDQDRRIDYNAHVKPILNKHCIACHGGVKQNGGFGLLTREQALAITESDRPAIVPGNGRASQMIQRLTSDDPELRMPLDAEPLSEEDIKILENWIDQGANWDLHWAYKPVEKVEPPSPPELLGAVGADDLQKHPIDLFVIDKLRDDLDIHTQSPEADKVTLLRRVSLDLIGIPAPAGIAERFLGDDSHNAYERLIDDLLARPEYGERWTSMWLDIARYADSKGFERDPHRDIWHYRDWVIKAFNQDMPYDQFLTEQLAGDLLADPSDEQLIATAFHRNTSTNDEGGSDNEEYRTYAILDRVNTTWEGILGTTFACVQCHSHPYDPFLQEDYYKFFAFFNNSRDADTAPDYPLLRHFKGEDSTKLSEFISWAGDRMSDEKVSELERFIKTWQPAYHSIEVDSFVRSDLYDTKYLGYRQNGSVRLKQVNLSDKEVLYFRYRTKLSNGIWQWYSLKTGDLVASTTLPSTDDKWKITSIPLTAYFNGKHDLVLTYSNPNLKDPDARGVSFDWFRFDEDLQILNEDRSKEKEFWNLMHLKTETTPIMIENPEEMKRETRVFDRGNWLVEKEAVRPGIPEILPPLSDTVAPNRMILAKWITTEKNPLTSRTMVNRIWAQIFGRGLVETLEDLGSHSPRPSHPELLDWLAYQFMHQHGWHLKSYLKKILMSATYKQQSVANDELLKKDPFNIYLSRGARVRLTAEQMRDQALTVSGLLCSDMYGPSIMPYQPIQWDVPYSRERWEVSEGDQQHRRSVYIYWKRTIPYPAMMIFDAAARDVCEARRIQTNTPLHALVTLNDPVYVEAAAHLAKKMYRQGESTTERITEGYKIVLGTPIPLEKSAAFLALFEKAKMSFEHGESDPKELLSFLPEENDQDLAALVVVANAMLNMDEFITKS